MQQLGNMTIGWFDFIPVIMIAAGIMRGRKRGMSEELLDFIQWLVIIFGGALGYLGVAHVLKVATGMQDFWARLLGYSFIAIGAKVVFSVIKRSSGEKLVATDTFGGAEYYLGMAAGAIRFLCMVTLALAILHSRQFTSTELAKKKRLEEELGMTFSGWSSIQRSVFTESLSGQFFESQLSFLLIEPTPYAGSRNEGIGRQRERMLDQVLDPKGK